MKDDNDNNNNKNIKRYEEAIKAYLEAVEAGIYYATPKREDYFKK